MAVEADGPAAQAGVTRGDILLTVGGKAVASPSDLRRLIRAADVGDEVVLEVRHGDEPRTLTVTLGERGEQPYAGLIACCSGRDEIHLDFPMGDALIREVVPDSPAAEAGLQVGDWIVAVDGQTVGAEHPLAELIAARQPGDAVALDIERAGEAVQVTVTLAEHPDEAGQPFLGVHYSDRGDRLFLHGDNLPPAFEDSLMLALPEGVEQGIILGAVEAGGPAAAAGLERGEVVIAIEGEPVAGVHDLRDAVAARRPGEALALTVWRDGAQTSVTVTLGEHPERVGEPYLGVGGSGFLRRNDTDGGTIERHFRFHLPHPDWELPDARPFLFPADPFDVTPALEGEST